eukprot:CAMPEP_0176159182 /NCGR_PEP_ID=MMETSP0120_2-20121206/81429_1 /TAXON_ID=160619 /ORGANISM="Kryptoperidinium foliaceum, Strain CCMP 1326" /LENGTH=197 /DNA_ID=CAMNT_0017496591 /DNA_START=35 /DNA_END=628 /DNA_ORIENTATION=+
MAAHFTADLEEELQEQLAGPSDEDRLSPGPRIRYRVVAAIAALMGTAAIASSMLSKPAAAKNALYGEHLLRAWTSSSYDIVPAAGDSYHATPMYRPAPATGDRYHATPVVPQYRPAPATGDRYHATPVVPGAFVPPPTAKPVVPGAFVPTPTATPQQCKYAIGNHVYVQGAQGSWHPAVVIGIHAGCNYQVQYTDGA